MTGRVVQQPWPPAVAGWYPGHLMHEEALAQQEAADRQSREHAEDREVQAIRAAA